MTSKSELEISGNLFVHPFAELISELASARVSGALAAEDKQKKAVVYFRDGRVVFAASNARSARLFQIMLDDRRLTREDIANVQNVSNDTAFAAWLVDTGFLSEADLHKLFSEQAESIVVDILGWSDGKWSFSSLRRVRDGLEFDVDVRRILFDYGRCLANDKVQARFRSLNERFHRSEVAATGLALNTVEGFVLSRVGPESVSVQDLISVSAMNELDALHTVYTLWLGGLIVRDDWQPAFSPEAIAAIRGAKLALKQEAKLPALKQATVPSAVAAAAPEPPKEIDNAPTLDEYLARVENAATYYDVLGVDPKADIPTIKRAYFSLAKAFHPDKFHSEGPETARRAQTAFTQMMQAHETLKSNESRDLYDYRMRKELAEREKREAEGDAGPQTVPVQQASEQFERGFALLADGEAEAAIPYLARAAHYAPTIARYRAYYGKALATDPKRRHQAEAEMQAALKLDPNNPAYRTLLARFFIQFNLLKRAEGELNRLLARFPSDREALDLLASLKA